MPVKQFLKTVFPSFPNKEYQENRIFGSLFFLVEKTLRTHKTLNSENKNSFQRTFQNGSVFVKTVLKYKFKKQDLNGLTKFSY